MFTAIIKNFSLFYVELGLTLLSVCWYAFLVLSTKTVSLVLNLQVLLQAVLPFDLLLDRKKRVDFSHNFATCSDTLEKPKVVRDAHVALASLVVCEEALERELFISTS